MSMVRVVSALGVAGFRTATSYRARFVFSLASVLVTAIPLFFVAGALQPLMEGAIVNEGKDYFSFLLLGFVVLAIVQVAGEALPAQVGGDLSNGFLESVLGTPAGVPSVLLGLVVYPLTFALARGLVMVAIGAALGMDLRWSQLPEVSVVLILLIAAHFGVGLIAAAAVLVFRSSFSIPQIFAAASALLGGAYWPTSVIPSWMHTFSEVLPLTYGLRAVRRVFLDGASLSGVANDVLLLVATAGFLLCIGTASFAWSLQVARRHGTLSHY
jgi:ABC-2 type transport system permease protein